MGSQPSKWGGNPQKFDFQLPPPFAIKCQLCMTYLCTGSVFEENHCWNDKTASIFTIFDDNNYLRMSDTLTIKMLQGEGRICLASCSSCNTQVGWKFIHSPVLFQIGKIGFMLPDINIVELAKPKFEISDTISIASQDLDSVDRIALKFMRVHGLLGMTGSFLKLHDDDPSYADSIITRGWGYSSASLEFEASNVSSEPPALRIRCAPMDPHTCLRVASVSKTITAVAVLRLVEAQKLRLEDKMFPMICGRYNRRFDAGEATQKFCVKDTRVFDITIRHLLQHTSGGWGNSHAVVIAMDECLSQEDLIERVFADHELDQNPGDSFMYSNFGYCLLGRVIEFIVNGDRQENSQLTYEQFIQQDILHCCGIAPGPHIEKLVDDDHSSGSSGAQYYISEPLKSDECSSISNPTYSLMPARLHVSQISLMDSHGGWVFSTHDLVLFAAALKLGRLLNMESVAMMSTPPECSNGCGYAMGWLTNSHAIWHNGILQGTGSLLVSSSIGGGMIWALTVNTGFGCPALDDFAWECLRDMNML